MLQATATKKLSTKSCSQCRCIPYIFSRCRWPPIYIQWPSCGPLVAMRGLGTEEASLHLPLSGTGLSVDYVPLGDSEWMHQIGCCSPEPVKWTVRWHRGSGDKRVGSKEASSGGPLCSPPLYHLVEERWVASTRWMAFGGSLRFVAF